MLRKLHGSSNAQLSKCKNMVIAATIVLFKFLLTYFLKQFKIGTGMQAMTGYFQKRITHFVRFKHFFPIKYYNTKKVDHYQILYVHPKEKSPVKSFQKEKCHKLYSNSV